MPRNAYDWWRALLWVTCIVLCVVGDEPAFGAAAIVIVALDITATELRGRASDKGSV